MIATVKAFSRESRHEAEFDAASRQLLALATTRFALWARWEMVSGLVQQATFCACLWHAFALKRAAALSAGELASFVLLVNQVRGLANAVKSALNEVLDKAGAIERTLAFLERAPRLAAGARSLTVEGEVAFEGVRFAYGSRPAAEVLRGLSFTINRGARVALVGPSGGGKTTVASLLLRLYAPTAGRVVVDGVDLRELEPERYHEQVALVAQTPSLFNTTVRNNLGYGLRRAPADGELEAAAARARAAEFIEAFPAGYETFVGDQGAQLSGGQRQRVAIARALVLRPRVLVLDEATSALDALNEHAVHESVLASAAEASVLVIAHRLSTVMHADEILAIDQGVVVERGTHHALLRRDGFYAKLVRQQLSDAID